MPGAFIRSFTVSTCQEYRRLISFAFYKPTVWISLLSALRDSSLSPNTFGCRMTIHIFRQRWTPFGAGVVFRLSVMTYLLTVG